MNRLSVHYNNSGNHGGFGDFLSLAQPAYVYSLNGNIKPDVVSRSPDTKIIYRRQSDGWQRLPNNFFNDDPIQNATQWMTVRPRTESTNLLGNWALNPADFYDALNEPVVELPPNPTPAQIADMVHKAQYLNTWMMTVLEIAHQNGFKLALFSFPFGSPCYEAWQYLIPSMELGKAYGAILSLHAYTVSGAMIQRNPDGSFTQDTLDWTLRHRKIYDQYVPAIAQLPVVYTEASSGNGYAVQYSGQAWIDDIGAYEQEVANDGYVEGICGFQHGGDESNLTPIILQYAQYIHDHPSEVVMPKLNIIVKENLIPQDTTQEELAYVQARTFKEDVLWSADTAKFLVQNSLPGSKVVVWEPSRWTQGDIIAYLGVPTEIRYFSETPTPEPIRLVNPVPSIPFRVTDPFDAPRDYANGRHEGLDLDGYNDATRQTVPVVACATGIVTTVNDVFSPNSYGKYVIVNHLNGYRTWYCHLSSILVTVGQSVSQGQQIGVTGATGTTAIHLHLNLQHIGHGLRGYYVPDVIDPLPYIDQDVPPPPPPVSTVKAGLHMAARGGDQTLQDWQAFDTARLQSIKFMSNHAYNDIVAGVQRVGASNVYFRMYADPSDAGALSSGTAFFNVHRGWFDQLYAIGVYNWEVGNENNRPEEGYGVYWQGSSGFSAWYRECARLIRQYYPKAKIIYPGLSPQPDVVPFWKPEIQVLINEGLVDLVGTHSYWQTPGSESWGMLALDGGQYYRNFLGMGRPLVITESSNNSQTVDKATKGQQYVQYLTTIQPGVESVLFFVSSTSNPSYGAEAWVGSQIPQILGAR